MEDLKDIYSSPTYVSEVYKVLNIEEFCRFVDALKSTKLLMSVTVALSKEQAEVVEIFEKRRIFSTEAKVNGTGMCS